MSRAFGGEDLAPAGAQGRRRGCESRILLRGRGQRQHLRRLDRRAPMGAINAAMS